MRQPSYVFLLLLLTVAPATAEERAAGTDDSKPFSLGYHQENDGPWVNPINGTDRYYAHENWGGRDPQGWQNQMPNEPTLQLEIERRWRIGAGGPFALELLPELGIGLGTLRTEARLGSSLRLGFNLPGHFGPPRSTSRARRWRALGRWGRGAATALLEFGSAVRSGSGKPGISGARGSTQVRNGLLCHRRPPPGVTRVTAGSTGRGSRFRRGRRSGGAAVWI